MNDVPGFASIEKQIKGYKKDSLIELLLKKLLHIGENPGLHYPYWRLLVLLKWILIYGDNIRFSRNAREYNLEKLIELTGTFETNYDRISFVTPERTKQFFRIIAFQQFPHQDKYNNAIIDRQLVFYTQFSKSVAIAKEFKQLTSIEITDFFNYCYFTQLFFQLEEVRPDLKYKGLLTEEYFDYFKKIYGDAALQTFLSLLTIEHSDDLTGLHKMEEKILQLYETNFFASKPFIYFRSQYHVPHRSVFLQTTSYFVYNFMKRNSNSFPEDFGRILEQYVLLGIKEAALSFVYGQELRKQYALGKFIDYKIGDDILVEVKATELHPRSGVSRVAGILQEDLKTTIVKAYTQLLSSANKIDNTKSWYGVIITYKEMYLGFGSDAWTEFLKEPVEEFIAKEEISLKALPPENLFFVSIKDWDWIMQVLKNDPFITLKQVLTKGKDCNLSPDWNEQVFMMEQVLNKYYRIDKFNLSYLDKVHSMLNVLPEESVG